ncbi:MAG: hypothetical protein NUW01_02050 [Gemmatimonadaceae bacterium]|nr:hypothetical protein [Gemmatimonadaceae bacterium]
MSIQIRSEPPVDLRARVAHHEAGHAVVARALHFEIGGASIVTEEDSAGRVINRWSEALLAALENEDLSIQQAVEAIQVFRAGRAAEERFLGSGREVTWGVDGSEDDDRRALVLANRAAPVDGFALMAFGGELTKTLVAFQWTAITRLAELLLEHDVVTADEIDAIMHESEPWAPDSVT